MKSYEVIVEMVQYQKVLVQAESRDEAESEVLKGCWSQVLSQGLEYVKDIGKIEEIEE